MRHGSRLAARLDISHPRTGYSRVACVYHGTVGVAEAVCVIRDYMYGVACTPVRVLYLWSTQYHTKPHIMVRPEPRSASAESYIQYHGPIANQYHNTGTASAG